jgi:F420H(2)-dependent quinone reductase
MNPAARRPNVLDHPITPKIVRLFSRANVWLYRKTGGRLGGKYRMGAVFPRGVPLLLLTTVGRKSGVRRTAPLVYLENGSRLIIAASQSGLPSHPLWYLNISANPEVEVQTGRRLRKMRARDATPEEREVFWPKLVVHNPDFASYQAWTDRKIPIVILEPLAT